MSLASADFEYIRKLVRDRTALVLTDDKTYLVESRLAPLMKKEGVYSIGELITRLKADSFKDLHQRVVEAMVTTETFFFRDQYPFEALQNFILPELLQRRQGERRLNLWSAACSSGQEPYSIAMLMREHFPQLASWTVQLIASDISNDMADRARSGYYNPHEIGRGLPPTFLRKYFRQEGKIWRINEEIRRMVDFHQLNLADPWPSLPPMDVIFLRNVLIYFDIETKQTILAQVRRVLKSDGYLFLGGGETTINLDVAFKPVQFDKSICYCLRT